MIFVMKGWAMIQDEEIIVCQIIIGIIVQKLS